MVRTLKLKRFLMSEVVTLGQLFIGTIPICYTLELPWNSNKVMLSCIPAGTYKVRFVHRSTSGKFRRCWHVQDVPERSEIMIHPANYVRQIRGCIAPGLELGLDKMSVSKSALAMAAIREIVGVADFNLEVCSK